jgi:hypothetical protein
MAPVTSNLITSNLENALLVLRFGPKSPPAVLPAKSIAWQMTSTKKERRSPRTFYISFPKITLRLQLRLSLPRRGGYNGHRYQPFSRSTLKPDLASDMYYNRRRQCSGRPRSQAKRSVSAGPAQRICWFLFALRDAIEFQARPRRAGVELNAPPTWRKSL